MQSLGRTGEFNNPLVLLGCLLKHWRVQLNYLGVAVRRRECSVAVHDDPAAVGRPPRRDGFAVLVGRIRESERTESAR